MMAPLESICLHYIPPKECSKIVRGRTCYRTHLWHLTYDDFKGSRSLVWILEVKYFENDEIHSLFQQNTITKLHITCPKKQRFDFRWTWRIKDMTQNLRSWIFENPYNLYRVVNNFDLSYGGHCSYLSCNLPFVLRRNHSLFCLYILVFLLSWCWTIIFILLHLMLYKIRWKLFFSKLSRFLQLYRIQNLNSESKSGMQIINHLISCKYMDSAHP